METEIELDVQPDAVNTVFWPYLTSRARFRLFWGGRDSSKSDFVALDLLLQCLTLPYFKCVLVRRYANTIKGSQWDTLKRVAEREGIAHLFTWGLSPLGIRCIVNGNSFVPFGMDDMTKAKSLSDPTHAWYEEANQTEKADCDVLSTSLRSSVPGVVFQEIYSFNPDHEGDYKTFWIWKKFFDGTGHPDGTSFSGSLAVDVDGQLVELPYEVLHSTARDNRWCPPERLATYKGYQFTDPYRYRVWYEGLWATKQTGNEWLPNFTRAAHVSKVPLLPGVNVFQSWDANALPYCAMLCAQTLDKRATGGKLQLRIFREYALRSPNSGITPTGHRFLKDRELSPELKSCPVFLTGDASMRSRKPGDERATTFDDTQAALNGYRDDDGKPVPGCLNAASVTFWPRRNPGVMRRRDFLNYLLAGRLQDVELVIDESCTELIADCEQTQLAVDGKDKRLFDDKVLGAKYQKHGHFTDVLEYYVCTVLQAQYEAFEASRGA